MSDTNETFHITTYNYTSKGLASRLTHHKYLARLRGCPESGLAAIDFRREHGLPEAPDDVVVHGLDVRAEDLVRKYSAWANRHARIHLHQVGDEWGEWGKRPVYGENVHVGNPEECFHSPEAVKSWLEGDIGPLMAEIWDRCQQHDGQLLLKKGRDMRDNLAEVLKKEIPEQYLHDLRRALDPLCLRIAGGEAPEHQAGDVDLNKA